ncbi:MAG: phosphodiester glycosidase family protein [Firmicutes bacterium]|nr:phosphodiester glycosidase family protein [Bacillota bacterium]
MNFKILLSILIITYNISIPLWGIQFSRMDVMTDCGPQSVYTMEVNPKNKYLKILPVIAHDEVFGFEEVSSMAGRKRAFAAVNGGFFKEYGQPVGMVMIDGMLITPPTGETPVLCITKNGNAFLRELNFHGYLKVNNSTITIDGLNRLQQQDEVVLFTRDFGYSTRAGLPTLNLIIQDGMVKEILDASEPIRIPADSMVLSFTGTARERLPQGIKEGDLAEFFYTLTPVSEPIEQAFEAGPWLVKDGKVIARDREIRVGVTNVPAPRTAVGIKGDGKVVFVVVDGRQSHSRGMTHKQLAEFLLNIGIVNGAALDGGGSSTMYYNGKVVNRPSLGRERKIGGSICILFTGKRK